MADLFVGVQETAFGAERIVVVKELLPRLAAIPAFSEMLAAEARLAAQLSHRNVVATLDLGRVDETLYVAMEYVEGLDLRELLRGCVKRQVGLPVEFSLHVVREVLSALDYAHRFRAEGVAGVVHRDVSPSNVLLSFGGDVKLCDFGIARAMDAALGEVPPETVSGKAGYMSPEQASGEAIDGRSDVFSAGVLLWELLSGRKLYRASPGPELLALARAADVPLLSLEPPFDLPHSAEIRDVVASALARERDARPSARELRERLDAWVHRAGLQTNALRFGSWMEETFGREMLALRRARLRAARALRLGPPVVLSPRARTPLPPGVAEPKISAEALEPPRAEPEVSTEALGTPAPAARQAPTRPKKSRVRARRDRSVGVVRPKALARSASWSGAWVALALGAVGLGAALLSALR